MGSLSLQPDYGVDSNPSLPRGEMDMAHRVARRFKAEVLEDGVRTVSGYPDWKATGDGTKVGLFIPLPESLMSQYPPKGNDKSPPHVTFLIVGNVPKSREAEFVQVLNGVLQHEPGPVRARLGELDRFVHSSEDVHETVFFNKVRFSRDMGSVRDRVSHALQEAGFEIADSYPLAYTPHATIATVPEDNRAEWRGPVPQGTWNFDRIAVWGMSKPYTIQMGSFYGNNIVPYPVVPRKYASVIPQVQSLQAYAQQLDEHKQITQALLDMADQSRLGRVGDSAVRQMEGTAEQVLAVVSGKTNTYISRITFAPRRGFRCTCPDSLQRGTRSGPCKHVLALALRWQQQLVKAEDRLTDSLVSILEKPFASS